jgi:hypothetical protein
VLGALPLRWSSVYERLLTTYTVPIPNPDRALLDRVTAVEISVAAAITATGQLNLRVDAVAPPPGAGVWRKVWFWSQKPFALAILSTLVSIGTTFLTKYLAAPAPAPAPTPAAN